MAESKRNYYVYMHYFPDKKAYIGLTRQKPEDRWSNGSGYKKQPVYSAIEKFGWENIEHIILQKNLTFNEAQELEKYYINKYDSINNGYNVGKGGGLGGDSWVEIDYNENTYSAEEILQFSTVENLTAHDVTTRLGHGWDIEDILSKPKTRKNIKFEYNGKLYSAKELVKFSKIKGLTSSDIFNRVECMGWDIDRALTQPKGKKLQPPGCRNKKAECLYEYKGKIYRTFELLQLSTVEGLTVGDITSRINQSGWSVEDAITKPKKQYNKKYEYNGKQYSSKELAKLSPYPEITHHTITDRINGGGWTVEDAIFTPIRKIERKILNN